MKCPAVTALGLVLLGMVTNAVAAHPQDQAAEKEVRDLIDRFYATYVHKDFDGFMALWSDKSPELALRKKTMRGIFGETGALELKTLEIVRVTIGADTARVRLRVELTGTDTQSGKLHRLLGKLDRMLQLAREGNAWKVRSYLPTEEELARRVVAARTEEDRQRLLMAEDKALVNADLLDWILKISNTRVQARDYPEAQRVIDLGFALAPSVGGKEQVARCQLAQVFFYEQQRKYADAMESVQKALSLARDAKSTEFEARALCYLGEVNRRTGKLDDAATAYEAGLRLARMAGMQELEVPSLNNFGLAQLARGKYDDAEACFEASATLAHALRDTKQEARAYMNIGKAKVTREKYAEALAAYQTSARLAHDAGDQSWEAMLQPDIAFVHEAQAQFADAVKAYESALKIHRELGDKDGQVRALTNLGRLYRRVGRFEEATQATDAAQKLQREIDNAKPEPKR